MGNKFLKNIYQQKRKYLDVFITLSSNVLILYLAISENKLLLAMTPFLVLRFAYVFNNYLLRNKKDQLASAEYLPSFSIIICTYNEPEENLQNLFRCIANSTVQPQEIIVIDDASNKPVHISDTFGGRLKIIRNEKNIGLRKSQIRAIEALQQVDYVLHIDSDMYFENQCIEKSLQFISNKPDGNIFGVRITIKNAQSNYLNTYIHSSYHGNYYKRLFESSMGITLACNGAFMFTKYAFIRNITTVYGNERFAGTPLLSGTDKAITNFALQSGKSYTIPDVSVVHEQFIFKDYIKKIQRTFKTSIIYQVRTILLPNVSPMVRLLSTLDVISFFISVPLQVLLLATLLQVLFFYIFIAVYLLVLVVRNDKSVVEVVKYNAYRFAIGIYFYLLKIRTLLRLRSTGWGNRQSS